MRCRPHDGIVPVGTMLVKERRPASPAAAYVNGHVLAVDGGFLADFGVPLAG